MNNKLFQPFIYIAGIKSLVVGIIALAVTAFIGSLSLTHFDGAIDMHSGYSTPVYIYFLEQLINWASLVLFFYIAGMFFSRSSVRLIDVAGTMAMARWPLLPAAVAGFGMHIKQPVLANITPGIILFSLLGLVFIIWMIALLYNAYSVACNIKGRKGIVVFIITLLIAEVASHLAIHEIYHHINIVL